MHRQNWKSDYNQITKDEKEAIIDLRYDKKTPSYIANRLKIRKGLVSKIIREYIPSDQKQNALKGIYKIKNDMSGKVFIGASTDIINTWRQIIRKADSYSPTLAQDLSNGALSFLSFSILITHPSLTYDQLKRLGKTFILYFNSIENGYNKENDAIPYDINLKGKSPQEILNHVFTH